ncbi:hypothetical protein AWENTII_004752 [Aspergillus wentii]
MDYWLLDKIAVYLNSVSVSVVQLESVNPRPERNRRRKEERRKKKHNAQNKGMRVCSCARLPYPLPSSTSATHLSDRTCCRSSGYLQPITNYASLSSPNTFLLCGLRQTGSGKVQYMHVHVGMLSWMDTDQDILSIQHIQLQ